MPKTSVYENLVTKQAELSGIVAKLADEGRAPTEEERTALKSLRTDINAIRGEWESTGRKAFLDGLNKSDSRSGDAVVLKSSESFAEHFKGESNPEDEGLNLGRVVRGLALGEWGGAELERKSLSSNSSPAGGYLVPEPLSSRVIDLARNKSSVIQAGAGTVPMTSVSLTMARVASDPTPGWYNENETIGETDMTFGAMLFTAHKMGCIVRISNELLEDAGNIQSIVEGAIASAMGLEIDRTAIMGNGVNQPRGIYNTSGINTVSGVGTPDDYDDFLTAVFDIMTYNFLANAAMYSPRTAKRLATMVTGLSGDQTNLTPPKEFTDLAKYVTNQIPNNLGGGGAESIAVVGQWDQYLMALRSRIRIEVSREADTAFVKDQSLIRATWRGDGAAIQPRAFSVLSGIA